MKKKCYVFDLDGTLAIKHPKRDWHDYHLVELDYVHENMIQLFSGISQLLESDIIFCTGRPDSCDNETRNWIEKNLGIAKYKAKIFFRKSGDKREDSITKQELCLEIQKDYDIICWFEDRQRVVDAIRECGVTVCQVAPGNF